MNSFSINLRKFIISSDVFIFWIFQRNPIYYFSKNNQTHFPLNFFNEYDIYPFFNSLLLKLFIFDFQSNILDFICTFLLNFDFKMILILLFHVIIY